MATPLIVFMVVTNDSALVQDMIDVATGKQAQLLADLGKMTAALDAKAASVLASTDPPKSPV